MNEYIIKEGRFNTIIVVTTISNLDIINFNVPKFIDDFTKVVNDIYSLNNYILEPVLAFSNSAYINNVNVFETNETAVRLEFKKLPKA